ncbi:hypothetical protein [Nocardiopsis valliformis]|nr:hypothetical protein [Nocardiopsis valliformis]
MSEQRWEDGAARGRPVWESHGELDDRFHHEAVPSTSGATHHVFWRR